MLPSEFGPSVLLPSKLAADYFYGVDRVLEHPQIQSSENRPSANLHGGQYLQSNTERIQCKKKPVFPVDLPPVDGRNAAWHERLFTPWSDAEERPRRP